MKPWLLMTVCLAWPAAADAPATPPRRAIELPELGRAADEVADHATEMRLGQAWLRQVRAYTPAWPDPLLQDYLEDLLNRLAAQTTLQEPRFSLVVVDDRSVNAFAVPGEVVGVNTGLLLTSETEGEVASVLAHELGHLSLRHFARGQEANQYNQWLALGGLLASIAAAAAGGPSSGNAGVAAGMTAQALASQNQLRYSRAFEQEADRVGLQTLTDAGFDPRDMPRFFMRLDRATRRLGFVPEFLLTHPLSSSRLADLERRVSDRQVKYPAENIAFRLNQIGLEVAYSDQPDALATAYREALKEEPDNVVTRYGLVRALLRQKRPLEAREVLQPLLKAAPGQREYRAAQLDALLQLPDSQIALQAGLDDLAAFPLRRSILIRVARAALAAGKPERIRGTLEAEARRIGNDPQLWRLLADCAARQKDALMVFRARAEVLFLNNQQLPAESQLRNALRLATGNYSLTAQLEYRLREMQVLNRSYRG